MNTKLVGEFEYATKYGPDSLQAYKSMENFLAKLDGLQVPLAALWVFDFSPQAEDGNVTATNQRAVGTFTSSPIQQETRLAF